MLTDRRNKTRLSVSGYRGTQKTEMTKGASEGSHLPNTKYK